MTTTTAITTIMIMGPSTLTTIMPMTTIMGPTMRVTTTIMGAADDLEAGSMSPHAG
jgi:hypothetical protein